jgi:hypothetical protein
MVVVRNIEVYALCEGCLLPFRLRCHVAYIPSGERVVGLSKLARVAEMYAKRLQTPLQFVEELAQAFADALKPEPLGVAVLAESWHLQWPGGCASMCFLFHLNGTEVELSFMPDLCPEMYNSWYNTYVLAALHLTKV